MASEAVPHGGVLVSTMLKNEKDIAKAILACDFDVELDERQLCDVELLMQGGFSPLTGYMDEADYKSVVNDMKLLNGLTFGLPVVYDTEDNKKIMLIKKNIFLMKVFIL
jgi:sulfate adenylyltransferase